MSSFYNTEWAQMMMESARSKANGKPVAHNTRLYDNGDGSYRLRYHNTDIVQFNADGTWTLANGGWNTITTLQRIREYSPVHLISVSGEWYVWLERREDDPKPDYVAPAVPAPYDRPDDYVQTGQYTDWRKSYRIPQQQAEYDRLMAQFGSVEQWREERKRQFAARKEYLAAINAWEERNRVPFYDGITVNEHGYAPRLRADGPSPAKLRRHEREVKRIKKAIDKYVKGYIEQLVKGMPMPGNGDCWYCLMRTEEGVTLGDSMPTLYPDGTVKNQVTTDHLLSHMEDRYYVPMLAVNALRERGYRDVGVYMWLDMHPETNTMGGHDNKYDTVKRELTKYLTKRLVPNAPTQ